MGLPQFLQRLLYLLLLVPFVALVFSPPIPWMAYSVLVCPFANADDTVEYALPEIELDIHRSDFPKDFVFGSATAAYQVGALFPSFNLNFEVPLCPRAFVYCILVCFASTRLVLVLMPPPNSFQGRRTWYFARVVSCITFSATMSPRVTQ